MTNSSSHEHYAPDTSPSPPDSSTAPAHQHCAHPNYGHGPKPSPPPSGDSATSDPRPANTTTAATRTATPDYHAQTTRDNHNALTSRVPTRTHAHVDPPDDTKTQLTPNHTSQSVHPGLADNKHLPLLSRRTSTVALFVGMRESKLETQRELRTPQQRAEMVFEYPPGPLEITPGLAKVLLRILRKAAERHGIDIDDIEPSEALTFQES